MYTYTIKMIDYTVLINGLIVSVTLIELCTWNTFVLEHQKNNMDSTLKSRPYVLILYIVIDLVVRTYSIKYKLPWAYYWVRI